MKIKETRTAYAITMLALCMLATLCGIFLFACELTDQTKYSFTVFLLAGIGVLIFQISSARDLRLWDQYSERIETEKQKSDLYYEKSCRLEQEVSDLSSKLEKLSPEESVKECDRLREKCEALESFRYSFPYEIFEDYVIYNIMRTDLQTEEYSSWKLVGEYGDQLWTCNLIRPYTQTYSEMLKLAGNTNNPQELDALNQGDIVLWK